MVSILILLIGYSTLACYTTLIAADSKIHGNIRKVILGVLWPVWFVVVMHRHRKQKAYKKWK